MCGWVGEGMQREERGSEGEIARAAEPVLPASNFCYADLKRHSGGLHVSLWHGCFALTLGREQTGVLSLSSLRTLSFLFSSCLTATEVPISQVDIKWLLIQILADFARASEKHSISYKFFEVLFWLQQVCTDISRDGKCSCANELHNHEVMGKTICSQFPVGAAPKGHLQVT